MSVGYLSLEGAYEIDASEHRAVVFNWPGGGYEWGSHTGALTAEFSRSFHSTILRQYHGPETLHRAAKNE